MYKYRKLSRITSISLICVLLASVFMLAPVSVSAAALVDESKIAEENIEIHLFNYDDRQFGPTYAQDGGNTILNTYIPSLLLRDEDGSVDLDGGYPYITMPSNYYNGSSQSWKSLFDKDTENGESWQSTMGNEVNVTHYAVKNEDGEGTGLFMIDSSTGNLYFDSSSNAAFYNPTTQKFELYTTAFTMGGLFHPFIDADGKNLSGESYTLTDSFFFGMSVEFDFIASKYTDSSGNTETIFSFTGDDDVVVYIDGVLVVDVSGGHTAYSGSVNFSTGKVIFSKTSSSSSYEPSSPTTIKAMFEGALEEAKAELDGTDYEFSDADGEDEAYAKLSAAQSASASEDIVSDLQTVVDLYEYIEENFDGDTFKVGTQHTLKMYYMERSPTASNCYISFNTMFSNVVYVDINKTLEHGTGSNSFTFNADLYVQGNDGNWSWEDTSYYATIETTGTSGSGLLRIYCDASYDATYYYRIYEAAGDSGGSTIYDCTSYLVEVTVENGIAEITKITYYADKHSEGVEVASCDFTNTKLMELTIEKEVVGITGGTFDFTLTVYDDEGNVYTGSLYNADKTVEYKFDENGEYSFSLTSGSSITLYLPYGYKYTVAESDVYTGYDTTVKVNNVDKALGDDLSYTNGSITADETVLYTNTLKTLPGAGGAGLYIFISIGLILCISSIAFMLIISGRKSKE